MIPVVIRSGGQTGVDRAALDFAIARRLPYVGWCPRGGWAEDFPEPPGLLAVYSRLVETPSPAPEQRTAWNVRDSHATLVLAGRDQLHHSPGTRYARQCAELVFLRPCLEVDPVRPDAAPSVLAWLSPVAESLAADGLILHIAGPRESEAPGIYDATRALLARVLTR
jgi:hypothetical protein